ncbi:MAG TPA: transcriptional repressor LexA [Armatimonadota bacterium]|nr:transcriptional repressor LexA [Armatimonadota bacterium]HOJ22087.1 transcriptional repressor LexA [Armatimonadota bacterium]HOM81023.1 transcriptional repressor LexA [Armatimonadota bacterium]HPO74441.1 transcriptional repressor LexA [Armatimonadota bacterium]
MKELTERQRQILQTIYDQQRASGYPPTVREIGEAVGLSSSCTVQKHLNALEKKGYIKRNPTRSRTIEILRFPDAHRPVQRVVDVPLLGTITAGRPILAEEHVEGVFSLPQELVGDGQLFMLRVRGDSMIGRGIHNGDYVVVRQQQTARDGEIVVALLGEEATVKTFYREPDRVRLQPENPTMAPIYCTDLSILGKVVMAIRTFN